LLFSISKEKQSKNAFSSPVRITTTILRSTMKVGFPSDGKRVQPLAVEGYREHIFDGNPTG
ncbi:MAG: hypothetical protein ACI92G_000683, partial [Candidatus Pelagisphaera sp.]